MYDDMEDFDKYQRLAGEAEARNVQTRLDYDMDERIANPPWNTLDVPESELIVSGQRGQATLPAMLGGTGLGLGSLLAMQGQPYNPQMAVAPKSDTAAQIANIFDSIETPIGKPLGGLASYINKVNYGDNIGYFDRLGAIPDPTEFSKLIE